MRRRLAPLLAALALLALAGCGSGAGESTGCDLGATRSAACASADASASAVTGSRPASPATVTITAPADGAHLSGGSVHVVVAVVGATIVQETSQHVVPTEGHVHLFLDGALTYMSYTLQQDLPVTHPGNYVLRAEFVGSDHVPFNPRVQSPPVLFTVG